MSITCSSVAARAPKPSRPVSPGPRPSVDRGSRCVLDAWDRGAGPLIGTIEARRTHAASTDRLKAPAGAWSSSPGRAGSVLATPQAIRFGVPGRCQAKRRQAKRRANGARSVPSGDPRARFKRDRGRRSSDGRRWTGTPGIVSAFPGRGAPMQRHAAPCTRNREPSGAQRAGMGPPNPERRSTTDRRSEISAEWCPGRDLNPDELPHTPLKRTRIPIPPPGQVFRAFEGSR